MFARHGTVDQWRHDAPGASGTHSASGGNAGAEGAVQRQLVGGGDFASPGPVGIEEHPVGVFRGGIVRRRAIVGVILNAVEIMTFLLTRLGLDVRGMSRDLPLF